MERNRDSRRATISSVNCLPRRRRRITILRDRTDEDRQMELQETMRSRDRARLQKKDRGRRGREFSKRRRVDRSAVQQRRGERYKENESTDSSDEECCEEEEGAKFHQRKEMNKLSPTSFSLSNNRQDLLTLRSSPVVRVAADDIFVVPIPRRARSISAKRLHETWNSERGRFVVDSSHRGFSPATANLFVSGSPSPMNKKMEYSEPRTRVFSGASNSKPSSLIQEDIEIEVAEALFDLMKQSQSQSHSQIQEKVERDSSDTADNELMRLKADGEDETNAFSVQNEPSKEVNAATFVVDSTNELKKERRVEKEEFPDDAAGELVGGDGFFIKGKESESPSCVKVNAFDIQDPTVAKASRGYAAVVLEAKKEAKIEIDLMASPPSPSSPTSDALVDIAICPEVMTQKSETSLKDVTVKVAIETQKEKVGVLTGNQLPGFDFEKRKHDILSASDCTTLQPQGGNELKKQPTSLFPFSIGMSSWSGVIPHPGYVPHLLTVLPIDKSARPSMTILPPQFKLSQPRPERCATHQYIARNIDYHQQLMKKSLSSGPSGPATLCGKKSLNLKTMLPIKKVIPGNPLLKDFRGGKNLETISGVSGKDKSPDAAAASSAATSGKPMPQQTSLQAPAINFLHCPGLMFPVGTHQTSMMAPANSSGPPQHASAVGSASLICKSTGKPSVNLPLPGGGATASLNRPVFPSNETAPYMAMLQNGHCPIPFPTNIPMPFFKGGSPNVPFNGSFYSSPVFNVHNQQSLSLPHALVLPHSQNTRTFSGSSSHEQPQCLQRTSEISDSKFCNSVTTHPPQPVLVSHSSSKLDTEISRKSSALVVDGLVSHSVKPGKFLSNQ